MGNIITFYSYKGGVGRSMALANTGVILAQWGYRVLMIDFDLEAPGLEKFFSSMLVDLSKVQRQRGIVDYIYDNFIEKSQDQTERWMRDPINIKLPIKAGLLKLWTAGRRNEDYFKKVRDLDFPQIYSTQNGGAFIENMRTNLKSKYDFILVDSRTGLTEIGGISTVQLPDIIVLLFTATDQAFEGAIDIVQRAANARQKIPFQRPQVPVIPIPSRLDVQSEFRLSQKWLDRFARELGDVYSSWLPRYIDPRALLDVTKLPHVSFFSYGESLPILEQGNSDPGGLGQAYENLSALLARNLEDVAVLLESRGEYLKKAARRTPRRVTKASEASIFISYSHKDKRWADLLIKHLSPLTQSRSLSIWDERRLNIESRNKGVSFAISGAAVAVLLVSPDYLASDMIRDNELPYILRASKRRGLKIFWIAIKSSLFEETVISEYQALNDPSMPLAKLPATERDRVLVEVAKKIADAAGRSY